MSTWKTPPARHPAVIGETVADEVVLLMPHAGEIVVLNEVGRTIWELIDGSHTPAQISACLCAEYDVNNEQARADTDAFLNTLLAHGLIVTAEGE